jgi:hypothetical protein
VPHFTQSYRIRQGALGDIDAIMQFYEMHPSEFLPIPVTKDLASVIINGDFLLAEHRHNGAIVATAAVFPMTPAESKTQVVELAGMRVSNSAGGLQPKTMQDIMVGLRLLRCAVMDGPSGEPDSTFSVVSIVRDNNAKSSAAMERAQLKQVAELPRWLRYDEHAWATSSNPPRWTYFLADGIAAHTSTKWLCDLGLLSGPIVLRRTNNRSQSEETLAFDVELAWLHDARQDIVNLAARRWMPQWSPLPTRLIF